jgi:hypothetical protein
MILSFVLWLQATPLFTYLRGSAYTYPCILALHMVAISLFGGMILMTNLRLLGLAMRQRTVSDVMDQLRVPKRWGLLLAVTCGVLMLGCKAEEYYYNPFVRMKLVLFVLLIVHTLVFRARVYTKAAEIDRAARVPGIARLAAALSLLLWIAVACMGRGIGYIEPPWGIHAAAPVPALHPPAVRL